MNNNSLLKKDFFEILNDKRIALQKIAFSQNPCNPNLIKRHQRKVAHAIDFLIEIEEIIPYLGILSFQGSEIELKNKTCFEKKIEDSDLTCIEFDGEFIRVAYVQNFPEEEKLCLVWMSSIKSL